MTTAHDPREKELFLEALDVPPEERTAYLDDRCGSNAELRRRVEELLSIEEGAPARFLRGEAADAPLGLGPGSIVGGFEIVRVIGEGGMGTVFEARQSSPRRDVALKVVRQGRATRDAVRRFRLEAEVLASLQHPGIAQIFDAGTARVEGSNAELPYFSMELVRGRPLLAFVQEHGLDRRARIELFARICDAVHHANQRGIIHRDLKSDNVLVVEDESTTASERGGGGQPKVLDFGVARVIGTDGQRTLETRAGDLIGTLSTMSPEQVAGDAQDVDVRSDVYALGVMLYQVLAGRLPLALEGLSVAQAIERIRSEEPRGLSAHDPSLRGDLEILVARTLEKDVERRLQSAAELASDLRRHLQGAPIQARADSALYVFRKTLRRHWALTAITGTALFALLAVAIISSLHSTRNRRLSVRLADQLEVSNVERGRLYTEQDDFTQAASLLWPAFLESPGSRYARWGLWELYSRTPVLGTWQTHEGDIGQLAFHPSGEAVASVGWDGQLFLIRAGEAQVVARAGHIQRSAHFNSDGDLLAVAGEDGLVAVFEYPSFVKVQELRASERAAMYVRFHPDGRLYTGGRDGELRAWDAQRGELVADLDGHIQSIQCIAFSAEGALVATGGEDPYVLIRSTSDAGPPRRIEADHGTLEALAFSRDGKTLATGGRDKRLRLFELPSGRVLGRLDAANGFIEDMTFHPLEPGILVTGGWWGTLFWDVAARRIVRRFSVGSQSLAMHAESGKLAASYGHELRIIDEIRLGSESLGGHVDRVACEAAPTGSMVATADEVGLVQLWDCDTAQRTGSFRVDEARVRSLSFDRAGARIAVGCESKRARVFDVVTGDELLALENHNEITAASVCLSPSGGLVAHASRGGRVRVVEIATGAVVFDEVVDELEALGVGFHPDGMRLVTTGREENAVRIWSLDGTLLDELVFASTPWSLAFSADGRRLAVSFWDKSVRVLDLERGELEATLADHHAVVWDVAFHPTDSSLLASASDDGTVKLWDVDERRRLATLKDYGEGEAFAASFSANGEVLVTAGRHGATLRSLSYFDRHVAANLPFYLERFRDDLELEIERDALETWAQDVLARPWPPVGW